MANGVDNSENVRQLFQNLSVGPPTTLPIEIVGHQRVANINTLNYRYGANGQSNGYPPLCATCGRIWPDNGSACRSQDDWKQSVIKTRGPRALRQLGYYSLGNGVHGNVDANDTVSNNDQYNSPDFDPASYSNAKFFVIKSFGEYDVFISIRYEVWASTPNGNQKLDNAYRDAAQTGGCPIFLFFSVNGSRQFCGVAEMVGPLDLENDMGYWEKQDKWTGQFRVKWHIIKDVPNSRLAHILVPENENKPVTRSRDTQEVNFQKGIEMLKIFKNYSCQLSLVEDFPFYERRHNKFMRRMDNSGRGSRAE